jgi:hypothetical protein
MGGSDSAFMDTDPAHDKPSARPATQQHGAHRRHEPPPAMASEMPSAPPFALPPELTPADLQPQPWQDIKTQLEELHARLEYARLILKIKLRQQRLQLPPQ